MLIDVSKEGWEVLILDGPASEQVGLPFKEAVGKLVYDLLELPGQSTLASWVPSKYAAAAGEDEPTYARHWMCGVLSVNFQYGHVVFV